MNVVGQENKVGNARARARGPGCGKVGKITKDRAPLSLIPKYRIREFRKPLINIGPISTPQRSIRGKRGTTTTSSSSTPTSALGGKPAIGVSSLSSSISTFGDESFVIVAVTAGRGQARGEIGMAAIDLQHPHMILSQMSDDNSWMNALTKIHMFRPVEILLPDTMGQVHHDPTSLYTALKSRFPDTEITEISRIHWNAISGLERIQTHSMIEFSSIELIVKPKYYALSAVSTLFKYIESIQHIVYTPNSVRFEYQTAHNVTMIDIESAQNLELVTCHGNKPTFCLLGALDRCSTPAGRRLLRASILQPPCQEELIKQRQNCVNELVSNKSIFSIIHPVIRRLYGTHRLLSFTTQRRHADTIDAAERNLNYAILLKHTIDTIPELKAALTTAVSPFFKRVFENLNNESFDTIRKLVHDIINSNVQSVKGYASANYQRCFSIKAGISDSLDVARQTYCELIEDMGKIVDDLGKRYSMGLDLACSSTLGYHIEMKLPRNFKFDVKSLPEEMIEAHVKGATLNMTTQELFVRNLHTKDAYVELHVMSNIILTDLFDAIKGHMGCLFYLCDDIAELDLILSLATVSSIPNFVKPTFGDCLEVIDGKHPVMEILGTESPTPNDIVASIAYNFHTIMGPNMGGKTIYLKQIVLLYIMAQIGCFVPATRAQFRITDHIFCKIGVRDDIEMNASTFMMEMKEAQYILQSLTPNSLVILDELCRSTTVEEGASLAWALSKQFLLSRAFTFSATHFELLLKLADLFPNVTNHYFEALPRETDLAEEARLVYTHKLKSGIQTIKNYGLTLARATGLPEDVLENAEKIVKEIQDTRDVNAIVGTPETTTGKVKRNYDKIVNVFEKMEKEKVSDEELYILVRGLESISYEEPCPLQSSLELPKPDTESSGHFNVEPKSSISATALEQSQDINTSTKGTSLLSSEMQKTPTKRLVKFTTCQPPSKLSKLSPSPCTSRQPLGTMNPPPNQSNSPFKVPMRPLLKKNLTEDPESPLFIPQSQHSWKSPFAPSSSSRSSSSSFTVRKTTSVGDSLSQLQALTKSRPSKNARIPEHFLRMFLPSTSPTEVVSQPLNRNHYLSNVQIQEGSQSRAEAIASLPKFLRPVGADTYLPEQYSHLRHIVKNIYEQEEVPEGPNQYYFMSKTMKKNPTRENKTQVDRCNPPSPLLGNATQTLRRVRMMSSDDIGTEDDIPCLPSPLVNFNQLVELTKMTSSDDVAAVSGLSESSEPRQSIYSPQRMDDGIILSSDSEEENELSQCSMTSIDAMVSARNKEAAIFRKIEGEKFAENEFFEGLQKTFMNCE